MLLFGTHDQMLLLMILNFVGSCFSSSFVSRYNRFMNIRSAVAVITLNRKRQTKHCEMQLQLFCWFLRSFFFFFFDLCIQIFDFYSHSVKPPHSSIVSNSYFMQNTLFHWNQFAWFAETWQQRKILSNSTDTRNKKETNEI